MKKTILCLALLFFIFSVNAQQQLSVGVSPLMAFPTRDFKTFNETGYGIGGHVMYSINKKFDVFFELAFTKFSGKQVTDGGYYYDGSSLWLLDSRFGARYKWEGFHAGLGMGRCNFLYTNSNNFSAASGLSISPEIGYKISSIDIVPSYNLNFAKYTTSGNLNYWGLKVIIDVFSKKI